MINTPPTHCRAGSPSRPRPKRCCSYPRRFRFGFQTAGPRDSGTARDGTVRALELSGDGCISRVIVERAACIEDETHCVLPSKLEVSVPYVMVTPSGAVPVQLKDALMPWGVGVGVGAGVGGGAGAGGGAKAGVP